VNRKPFETIHLSEVEAVPGPDTLTWIPVRRRLDIRAFGVNAYSAQNVSQDVVEDHTEAGNGHEELYTVLSGRATFTVAGEEIDAPAGTLVFIRDPHIQRAAKAAEPGTTVLAVGGKAGEAYHVSAWEFWFAAEPHRRAGDYRKAVEVISAGLAEHPEHPALLYNLACAESLAGDTESALSHLKRSVALEWRFGEYAESDEDFDAIRDEPGFASAIAREP
jgi:mannose-6-phosphate isomerase-like protein (cupin superfamily)